jgi:hypothetical protein
MTKVEKLPIRDSCRLCVFLTGYWYNGFGCAKGVFPYQHCSVQKLKERVCKLFKRKTNRENITNWKADDILTVSEIEYYRGKGVEKIRKEKE